MALENLTNNEIVKGETVELTITLDEGTFESGDVVSACFERTGNVSLFSKTATFTPGTKTAAFTIVGTDTSSIVIPTNPGRITVFYEVKVTNSGNETFLKQETGKLRGSFYLVNRLC